MKTKELKELKDLKVFLIFVGIIGCGIANGFYCVRFGFPENLEYMTLPTLFCVGLLILHRWISKNWEKPDDPWDEGLHVRWFWILFCLSISVTVMLSMMLFSKHIENEIIIALVSSITIAIASGIASIRERKYTDEIVSI